MKDRIFVSSTSDLAAERQAIRKELENSPFEPYLYEPDDRLKRGSPRDHLRSVIRQCNLFVLLLGRTFGSPYDADDAPEELRDASIVEWEHSEARSRLRSISMRVFEKSYPEGVEIEPEQLELRRRLGRFSRGDWIHRFDDERDDQTLLLRLRNYLEWWQGEPRRELLRILASFLLAIAALAGLTLLASFPAWAGGLWLPAYVMKPVLMVLGAGATAWSSWRLIRTYRGL